MTLSSVRVVLRLVDLSTDLCAQLTLSSGEMMDRVQEIHDEIDVLAKELVQLEMRQAERKAPQRKLVRRQRSPCPFLRCRTWWKLPLEIDILKGVEWWLEREARSFGMWCWKRRQGKLKLP